MESCTASTSVTGSDRVEQIEDKDEDEEDAQFRPSTKMLPIAFALPRNYQPDQAPCPVLPFAPSAVFSPRLPCSLTGWEHRTMHWHWTNLNRVGSTHNGLNDRPRLR